MNHKDVMSVGTIISRGTDGWGKIIDILGHPSYSKLHDEYCDIYFLETGQKLRQLQSDWIEYYMMYDVPNFDQTVP